MNDNITRTITRESSIWFTLTYRPSAPVYLCAWLLSASLISSSSYYRNRHETRISRIENVRRMQRLRGTCGGL
jgi:hypothetical protein